jgi:2-(1,2-epoxy-1,2-dihydrophenyl)acetyl-CoA isomerase
LPRLVSLVRAKEIAVFGEPLSARDAERWGMINRTVPAADFETTLREWAHRLAHGPTVRMGHIKGQLNTSLESSMRATFREEATLLGMASEDSHEAMRAYAERRDPNFTGR